MLGQRTKLLPPSFFSAPAVDDNNNNNGKARIDSFSVECSDEDSDDDCNWVPLGFASSIDNGTVSEKRAYVSPSQKDLLGLNGSVDGIGDDPFQLTFSNNQEVSSDSLRRRLVETGRKRCSPYPPLAASTLRSKTTLQTGEKYVRLNANDHPNGSYAPMRLTSDDDSNDEDVYVVMQTPGTSTGELRDDSSSCFGRSVVSEVASSTSILYPITSDEKHVERGLKSPLAEQALGCAIAYPEAVAEAVAGDNSPATPSQDAAPGDSNEDTVIRVSKQLSWILRHGAHRMGLKMDDDGFLDVESILTLREFVGVTLEDVISIVKDNDKKRFTLKTDDKTGLLKVRANQGHSIAVKKLDIKKISAMAASSRFYKNVIHGTNSEAWELIKETGGLSRMTRNHIHFAMGEPGKVVISGIRSHSTIWIYVDLAHAIRDGFEFFISANKVILTPGNTAGFLPLAYFSKVIQVAPYKRLSIPEAQTVVEEKEESATEPVPDLSGDDADSSEICDGVIADSSEISDGVIAALSEVCDDVIAYSSEVCDDVIVASSEVCDGVIAASNYPVLMSTPPSPRSHSSNLSDDEIRVDASDSARSKLYNPLPPSPFSRPAPVVDEVVPSALPVVGPARHSSTAVSDRRSVPRRSARHVNFEWGIVRSSLDMASVPDRNRYPRSPCSPFRTPPPASQLPQPQPDFLRKTKIAAAMSSLLRDQTKGFIPLRPAAPTTEVVNALAQPDALVEAESVEPYHVYSNSFSSSPDIPDLEPLCDQMSSYIPLFD